MDELGDRPREACGVVGVVRADGPVAVDARDALTALQHRGEETAGLCVVAAGVVARVAGAGLVADVLPDAVVVGLPGSVAVGHVRYSTSGGKAADQAQPIERRPRSGWFAIAHNGSLIDSDVLALTAGLPVRATDSDTTRVADLLAAELDRQHPCERPLEQALLAVLPRLTGSFSFVLSDGVRLYGVRDRHGLRPLCLGRLRDGWVLASETPALRTVGARFVREVEPGELVVVDAATVRSVRPFPAAECRSRLCLFEFVYFSRPDGELAGRGVGDARVAAGRALADFAPLPPDTRAPERPAAVVAVPSSGLCAAAGFAARSGLPLVDALRLRGDGRSFLLPTPAERHERVGEKLAVDVDLVRGRRLIVVDDSLVRGTTARAVVQQLRRAGAAEVHLRIASPPWRWACHFGIDAGRVSELAAGVATMSEVLGDLGCDTLAYLPLDRLAAAAGGDPDSFCTGCMTGRYPVPVPAVPARRAVDLFLSVPHRHSPDTPTRTPLPSGDHP